MSSAYRQTRSGTAWALLGSAQGRPTVVAKMASQGLDPLLIHPDAGMVEEVGLPGAGVSPEGQA